MEFTGVYNRPVLNFLTKNKVAVWLEMPVAIIRSMGLQRGKNDKVDAKRIASYAYIHQEDSKLWEPASENIELLKDLISSRQRLIKSKNILNAHIAELKEMKEMERAKQIEKSCYKSLKSIDQEIILVSKRITDIIKNDSKLSGNYKLLLTIPGIGPVTALNAICSTNNFTYYQKPKQLACYAGCAPFEHRSGTSVRGKARVIKMANHELKTNLTLAAFCTIKKSGFMHNYYQRKIKEGKQKMSAINAVRNKLIHLMTAIIRNQQPFIQNYQSKLAA